MAIIIINIRHMARDWAKLTTMIKWIKKDISVSF